jgi:hypothetical protein
MDFLRREGGGVEIFCVVFRVVLLKEGRCSRIFHFLSSLLLHTKLVWTFLGGREEGVV